jgi:carbamate kinase
MNPTFNASKIKIMLKLLTTCRRLITACKISIFMSRYGLISLTGEILVLALGGNAIIGESRTFQSQLEAVSSVTEEIAKLVRKGYGVVITHGNGPQVGDALLRHESARHLVPPLPLYACVAETQGILGSMIQSSFSYHLDCHDLVSLVSIVYVSKKDPAFKRLSKPIGPVYDQSQLEEAKKRNPNSIFKEIGGLHRYRRLVASPDPLYISGSRAVKDLLERGYVVITAGGGGIPAIKQGGRTVFVDAVVDKDLASEKIATSIGASKFVSLTDVEGAYLDYIGSKKLLRNVTAKQMKTYLRNGEFEEGSMAPKVKAAVRFAENTGNRAIICSFTNIFEAIAGRAGTVVRK